MLLFYGFLQIGKEKKCVSAAEERSQWQKIIKVFREVKAALMQIMQGGRFNQLGAAEGSVPAHAEEEHQYKQVS